MRYLRWSAVLATTIGLALLLLAPDRAVIAARVQAPEPEVAKLEVFYTAPMLVRAGERVEIPVDVVCATVDGAACPATAVLSVAERAGVWRSFRTPARSDLRFDLSAPVGRSVPGGAGAGSVAFRIRALAGTETPISPTQRAGASPTLRVYVTRHMPTVRVPAVAAGQLRTGREVLFLPWGTGRHRAGLRPGNESPTLGPSSFDVGRRGAIVLVDALQNRLARFVGGRLVWQVSLGGSVWADVAVGADGTAYLASRVAGSPWHGMVRAVGRAGRLRTLTTRLPGMPSEIAMLRGVAYVRVLPLDAWVPAGRAEGSGAIALSTGRPLGAGSQLLVSGTGDRVRVGTVRRGRVRHAVEVVPSGSHARFGEVALAEPDGAGGYWVVVHVGTDGSDPADRYQVVHVDARLRVRTFMTPAGGFAESMVLSRFRMGPHGSLYQMRSEPDGLHVVRYRLQGRST